MSALLEISTTSSEPMTIEVDPSGTTPPKIPRPVLSSRSNSQSNPSSATSTPKFRTKACMFFADGKCRFGDECRFSHDPTMIGTITSTSGLPSPSTAQAATGGSFSKSSSANSSTTNTPVKPSSQQHTMSSHSHSSRGSSNSNGHGHGHGQSSPGQHHYHNHHNQPQHRYSPGGHPSPSQRHQHSPASAAAAPILTGPILLNDAVPPPGTVLNAPPAPIIVNLPPNLPVYSIDVECVATGIQHNSRSVAQVSLVDAWARPLFNVYIKQEKPVVSYLTELTGLTKEVLDTYGIPLADAMAQLRSLLSPHAILVGHSIQNDVQWLQLAQGVDYHSLINLSDLFRVWNMNHQSFTYFSQDHIASVWLNMKTEGRQHNAVADAAMSMSLFNAYRTFQFDPNRIFDMQRQMLLAPRVRGFSALHPIVDGCCMGNRKNCICGAPFE